MLLSFSQVAVTMKLSLDLHLLTPFWKQNLPTLFQDLSADCKDASLKRCHCFSTRIRMAGQKLSPAGVAQALCAEQCVQRSQV